MNKRFVLILFFFFFGFWTSTNLFAYEPNIKSSSGTEKYKKNKMFCFSSQQMQDMRKEDGINNYYYRLNPLPENDSVEFGVDGANDVYVIFENAVRVFDSKGNLLEKIKLENLAYYRGNSILVDENGNFLIYDRDDINGDGYLYSKGGQLLKHIVLGKVFDSPEFSNGTIFSKRNGEVYFALSGAGKFTAEYKNSDFDKNYTSYGLTIFPKGKTEKSLPLNVDGYQLQYVDSRDLAGNVYVVACKVLPNVLNSDGHPMADFCICKFDRDGHFLALVPSFNDGFVDTRSENVYEVQIENGSYCFAEWEKNN